MEELIYKYPEKVCRYRNGKSITYPAYEVSVFMEGNREIAHTDHTGTLLLRTDYIAHKTREDFNSPYSIRIKNSPYEKQYEELINKYAKVSEYTSL